MHIYISNERENKLREYARKTDKAVSAIVGEWIDALEGGKDFVEESKQILQDELALKPMCERPFCKNRSEGKYRIVTDGVDEITQNLCVFHWNVARKEGEVHAV